MENLEMIHHIRENSLKEICRFIKKQSDTALCSLICGDFNILRYPLPDIHKKKIIEANPPLASKIPEIEACYDQMMSIFKHLFPQIENVWDNYGEGKPITYGRVKLVNGERTPVESVLSNKYENMSEMALDYVLCFYKEKNVKFQNLRLRHHEVTEKFEPSAFGTKR
jgi:hypothetical protein